MSWTSRTPFDHELEDHSQFNQFINQRIWQLDPKVSKCNKCSSDFTMFVRKHHCRLCGKIYCNECSDVREIRCCYRDNLHIRSCRDCYHDFNARLALFHRLQTEWMSELGHVSDCTIVGHPKLSSKSSSGEDELSDQSRASNDDNPLSHSSQSQRKSTLSCVSVSEQQPIVSAGAGLNVGINSHFESEPDTDSRLRLLDAASAPPSRTSSSSSSAKLGSEVSRKNESRASLSVSLPMPMPMTCFTRENYQNRLAQDPKNVKVSTHFDNNFPNDDFPIRLHSRVVQSNDRFRQYLRFFFNRRTLMMMFNMMLFFSTLITLMLKNRFYFNNFINYSNISYYHNVSLNDSLD